VIRDVEFLEGLPVTLGHALEQAQFGVVGGSRPRTARVPAEESDHAAHVLACDKIAFTAREYPPASKRFSG
jgi:hypothetical protein